jgi:hypothetical protein
MLWPLLAYVTYLGGIDRRLRERKEGIGVADT